MTKSLTDITKRLLKLWRSLIDLIAPRACEMCGTRLGINERLICTTCNALLPRTDDASPCQFLYARLTIEFGIESGFDHAQCQWRTFHHDLCPFYASVLKLVERHHLVDHSHALGFNG